MAVPVGLRLVSVDLDGQAVDVQRDACATLPAILGTQITADDFDSSLPQNLQVCGFGQHSSAETRS